MSDYESSDDVGPERCSCGKVAEPGRERCHACEHGMPRLPVRCRSTVKIGDRPRVWGCGAVLINGEWCFQRPGSSAQDGAICPTCAHLLHESQRKARVRLQRSTERKAAKGFEPFDGDAFR